MVIGLDWGGRGEHPQRETKEIDFGAGTDGFVALVDFFLSFRFLLAEIAIPDPRRPVRPAIERLSNRQISPWAKGGPRPLRK